MVGYIKYILKETDSSLNISLIIFSCLVTYLVPQIKYIMAQYHSSMAVDKIDNQPKQRQPPSLIPSHLHPLLLLPSSPFIGTAGFKYSLV